jgi:voltage-gated potassium channel
MTDRQRRWLRYLAYGIAAFLVYAAFVWAFFQFETFNSSTPTLSFGQAVWYVVLNPTGLGDTTTALFPATLPGRTIGILFALTSIGLFGVFIGRVTDLFQEVREQARLGRRHSDLTDHVVILGWDDYSRRVTRELVHSEIDVAVITDDKTDIDAIRDAFDEQERELTYPVFAQYDNYQALDRYADISHASRIFLNRRADTDTLITLFNVHRAFEQQDPSFIVRVRNERLLDRFDLEHKDINVTPVWTFGVATALIASYIYEPEVAQLGRDLIEAAEQGADFELQQYRVSPGAPFSGDTYNQAFDWFFERGVFLIGVADHTEPTTSNERLTLLADTDEGDNLTVAPDNYLLVVLESAAIDQMERWTGHSKGLDSLAAD